MSFRRRHPGGTRPRLAADGVIEDATACYRTLARDFAGVKLPSGLTGTQAFAELAADKRSCRTSRRCAPRWEGRRLDKVESNDPFAAPPLVLVDPFLTASAILAARRDQQGVGYLRACR